MLFCLVLFLLHHHNHDLVVGRYVVLLYDSIVRDITLEEVLREHSGLELSGLTDLWPWIDRNACASYSSVQQSLPLLVVVSFMRPDG